MNPLASPAGLCVAVPLVAAVLLPLVQDGRAAGWGNVGASALCLALACLLPGRVGTPPDGIWLADRLAATLALLVAFSGLTAAWFGRSFILIEAAALRFGPNRLRVWHALFQGQMFCLLLAALSDGIGLAWAGLAGAAGLAVLALALPRTAAAAEAAWTCLIRLAPCLALALLGVLCLALAAGPGPGGIAPSWTGLAAAPQASPALLGLGFAFVLIGAGAVSGLVPLHAAMVETRGAVPPPLAAACGGVGAVALAMLLRLRFILAAHPGTVAPGPPLLALGLLTVLLSAAALWSERDVRRWLALAGSFQAGLVACAFGLFSPAACFAGLLVLVLSTLTLSAADFCVARAAQVQAGPGISGLVAARPALGLTLAASLLALAGLPPFGQFVGLFLLVTETTGRAPLLVLPLGIALVAGGGALLVRLQALCLGPPMPIRTDLPRAAHTPGALVPAWLHLLAALALGLAMPAQVAAWFWAIALGSP